MEEFPLIQETKEQNNNDNNISKDIICNICKENCFIDINNYTFKLHGCKNNHVTNNILFHNFEDTQKISQENHHENEKEKYKCDIHNGEQFTKYCKDHNKNICIQCENEHKNCKTIYFGDILPNKDQLDCEKLNEYIKKLKNEINEIINNLKYIMNNLDIYYNISKNTINKFINSNKRNYWILENTNQFIKFNSIIVNDIKCIINNDDIFDKYNNIINIYDHIKGIKYSNYILAEIYISEEQINKDIEIINDIVKVCREKENIHFRRIINYQINSKNIEIEIDGITIPFSKTYKFKEKGIHILKYYIKGYLSNISGIFKYCKNIKKIDMTNFKIGNIIDMSYMFSDCYSLEKVDLSNFNTKNVKDMSYMFSACYSLEKVDLSNFNTKNVKDMTNMFSGCKSLKNIDLSNFNTENVENMRKMFSNCVSLENVDLSNFNTKNVKDMGLMFSGCKSLNNIEQIKTKDKKIIEKFGSCIIF